MDAAIVRRTRHRDGDDDRDPATCGVDIVDVEAFSRTWELRGDAFLRRVFSDRELSICAGRPERLAARFAAKEAVAKALGTGLRGAALRDIEVRSDLDGRPTLRVTGLAARRARAAGIDSWSVSLSHTRATAIAFVVAHRAHDADLGRRGNRPEDR